MAKLRDKYRELLEELAGEDGGLKEWVKPGLIEKEWAALDPGGRGAVVAQTQKKFLIPARFGEQAALHVTSLLQPAGSPIESLEV